MKKNLFKVIYSMTNSLLNAFLRGVFNLKEESRKCFLFSLLHKLYVMKAIKLTALSLLVILAISCKETEDDIIYQGEVREQTTDCTGLPGDPIIIKIYNSAQYDSVYTLTLPRQYYDIGEKISFKMRPLQKEDIQMVCKSTVFGAKQVIVFDVTSREIN